MSWRKRFVAVLFVPVQLLGMLFFVYCYLLLLLSRQASGVLGNGNVTACLSQSRTKFRRNGKENRGESVGTYDNGLEDTPETHLAFYFPPKQDTPP